MGLGAATAADPQRRLPRDQLLVYRGPVRNAAWVRNPIDAFIAARHEAKGLRPAPEADRRTLLRRLSLDLLGLPPAPEEVDAFLADRSPEAYEKLVERLLASPHYGERWARHWLDLANGEAHVGLGYVHALRKNAAAALREAHLATLYGAGDYGVLHNVACVYSVLGREDAKGTRA